MHATPSRCPPIGPLCPPVGLRPTPAPARFHIITPQVILAIGLQLGLVDLEEYLSSEEGTDDVLQ